MRLVPYAAPALLVAALAFAAPGTVSPACAAEGGHAESGGIGEIVDLFRHGGAREAPASKRETTAPDPAKRLAEVHRELGVLDGPGGAAAGSPAGTPEAEIADRMRLLHQLERSLSLLIDARARQVTLVAARKSAEERAVAWRGFPEAAPYPLPFVDGLDSQRQTVSQQIVALKSRAKLLHDIAARLEERLRTLGAGLRQAEERTEHAKRDDEVQRSRWLLELARLRGDEASTALDQTRQAQANVREELATAQAELRLVETKLRTASGHVRFTQSDLDTVLGTLAANATTLDAASDRALEAWRAASRAADAAPAAEADLRRQQVENASLELEVARMRVALNDYERRAWTTRYAVMNAPTRARAADAYENLVNALASLQAWSEYQREGLASTDSEIADLDAQLRSAPPAQASSLRALRDTYVEREVIQRRAADATRPLASLLARWQSNATTIAGPRSWSQHAAEAWAAARLSIERVWNFELFSVEDSFETDEGRTITARRSITIGKTVGALLLIVAGYWLCVKLAHLAHWLVMRLLGRSHAQANIVRRWTLAFLVAVLVMSSLLAVRIPLTVFAFLGGALAIGVGFGAQNLLKNLMSGIMLLVEKPLRVGDYIEFGEVRGRVTNIGFRASVVRAEDGVHTLIPNSTVIESNVTNLTFTSPAMRLQLDVGVAYGTDPEKVREVLLAAALSHPAVLKSPEPLAFLDDFAADAQKFRLVYWIDASPPAHFTDDLDTAEIASGVRERIVTRLAETGIGIPFPQRTLHVDAPLRVEIAQGLSSESIVRPAPKAAEG